MTEPSENELDAFAADLASLRPCADRLDRVHLAYLAGQASVRATLPAAVPVSPARRWAWPVSFAAMTATAALFGALLLRSPLPQQTVPVEQNSAGQNSAEQLADQWVAPASPAEWTAAQSKPQPSSSPCHERVRLHGMSVTEIEQKLARPWRPAVRDNANYDPSPALNQPPRRSRLLRAYDDFL